jgi:hypothetical protein
MKFAGLVLAGLTLAAPAMAAAGEPEQIDQLEPFGGEWQVEYFGTFGPGSAREHSLEAIYGLSDRLAIGVEVQAEYAHGGAAFDSVGVKILYRFTAEEAPIALGLQVQLAFDGRAALTEAEARLIAEVESRRWWAQGNVMVRRSGDSGETSIDLAYAGSLQHSLGRSAWFGVEASGQPASLRRQVAANGSRGHFVGPSLTFRWEPARGRDVEIGFACLRLIAGDGPTTSARAFVQLRF